MFKYLISKKFIKLSILSLLLATAPFLLIYFFNIIKKPDNKISNDKAINSQKSAFYNQDLSKNSSEANFADNKKFIDEKNQNYKNQINDKNIKNKPFKSLKYNNLTNFLSSDHNSSLNYLTPSDKLFAEEDSLNKDNSILRVSVFGALVALYSAIVAQRDSKTVSQNVSQYDKPVIPPDPPVPPMDPDYKYIINGIGDVGQQNKASRAVVISGNGQNIILINNNTDIIRYDGLSMSKLISIVGIKNIIVSADSSAITFTDYSNNGYYYDAKTGNLYDLYYLITNSGNLVKAKLISADGNIITSESPSFRFDCDDKGRDENDDCIGETVWVYQGSEFAKYSIKDKKTTILFKTKPSEDSSANALSFDGSVIVGKEKGQAFKYKDESGVQYLGDLGGNYSEARAISAYQNQENGYVIAGDSKIASGSMRAFKYSDKDGIMHNLGTLGGDFSEAFGVSNDGSVIIGNSTISNGSMRAFKYSDKDGIMHNLGTLTGYSDSRAIAVSGDGNVVIGNAYNNNLTRAFAHTDKNGIMDLGTLGGNFSEAVALSGDGSVIIGNSTTENGVMHVFISKLTKIISNASSSTFSGSSGKNAQYSSGSVTNISSKLIDVNNTYSSVYNDAMRLYSLFNLKNSLLNYALNKDCNEFGANNLCISLGAAYNNVAGQNISSQNISSQGKFSQSSGNMAVAYRFNPNLKAGLILDQSFKEQNPQNFTIKNSQPLLGAFVNFSQNKDQSGFNLRFFAVSQRSNLSLRRVALANTEAGVGDANFKNSAFLAKAFLVNKVTEKLKIEPSIALRQTKISRSAYSESSGADFPISFDKVSQDMNSTIFGLMSNFEVKKSLLLNLGISVEANLKRKVSANSGIISTIGDFSTASPKVNKANGFIDAGFVYKFGQDKQIDGNLRYGNQALKNSKDTAINLNYSIGF